MPLPNVIPELDPMRWALIDTMEDVICNTVGAALGFALYDITSKIFKGSEKLDSVYYTAMLCVCCIVLACFIVGNWHRLTH